MKEMLTKQIQKAGLWTSRTEVEGLKKLIEVCYDGNRGGCRHSEGGGLEELLRATCA